MTKITYTYTMNDNAIEQAIASLAKRTETLTQDYQRVAVSILQAFKSSGDKVTACRRANAVANALGKGMRKNSMVAWFQKNAPMVWNEEAKELVFGHTGQHPVKHWEAIADTKELAEVKWWDAVKPEEPKPLDWTATLLSLVKKAEKDLKEHGPNSKVSPEQLAILQGMVPQAKAV